MTQAANLAALGTNVNSSGALAASTLTGTLAKATLPTGSVLQVVNVFDNTYRTTTSATFATAFSASITPTSSTSKILVMISLSLSHADSDTGYVKLLRGSTPICVGVATGSLPAVTFAVRNYSQDAPPYTYAQYQYSQNYLDSPATTSSVTYNISWADAQGSGRVFAMNGASDPSTSDSNFGRTTSTVTLMEIAA